MFVVNWAQRPFATPFLTRLLQAPGVGVGDLAGLAATSVEIRIFAAGATIVAEGDRIDSIHVLFDGWAGRTTILQDGSRHMPALFVAGDACDLGGLYFAQADCMVTALTRCTVAMFDRDALNALLDRHRGARDAIHRMMAVESAIAMRWSVGLGRRSARERMAHLLCELFARLNAVGAAQPGACALPLTQEELSDVLGLTAVHVNRTLQFLRGDGLIQLKDQRLTILDWPRLKRIGGFDAAYLHLADPRRTRGHAPPAASGMELRLSA